ncbi:MAG: hypothetical protein IKY91_05800 [Akkermansia sp.]|nr:hypothetical protein [Akkermansia sp.]
MYTKIVAQVFDQTLRVTNIPKLASGGENEVRVEVTFDTLWTGFGKTAIFYRENKKNQVYHVIMKSDSCIVPREVMVEPGVVCFAILGTSGATVRTTEVVALTVAQGAITGLSPFEPLPDVYRQLMSAYGRSEQALAAERARIDNLVSGNTSDEAEVVDIRSGANGKTYLSAGTAVREQLASKADKGELERLRSVVDFDYQHLDRDVCIAGEYWSTATETPLAAYSASGYLRYPEVSNLPAGVYCWKTLSANFTWIENIATGDVTKLSALAGDDTSATIGYAFNLYATVTGENSVGYFCTGDIPAEYLFGAYNVRYAETTPRTFYCGPTRKYTRLKDAIAAAEAFMDSVVYVDRATYDLVEEYGAAFFANYTPSSEKGIVLKNRVRVIFEQGAKVVCNYTGDNVNVHTYFSPFNAGEYGFTLENAWVESNNTRYTMHDELSGSATPNCNVYKRCTFIHDSSSTSWGAHQALGGGFGSWSDVLIEDCFMSAVDCDAVLTYHNAGYENPGLTEFASRLVVRGCCIEGTVRVNSTGYSKMLTHAYVSGNSLKSEPESGKTTADAEKNVVLHAWGNTITG